MRFSLLGIPVHVTANFWIIGFLLGMDRADEPALLVAWLAAVFLSVLIHELGHALTARAFGHPVEIALHGLGGTATWGGGERPITSGQRLLVSLAGPGLEMLVGLVVVGAWLVSGGPEHRVLQVGAADFALISVVWGALNLVPIPPLDGAHAVEAASTWLPEPARPWAIYAGAAVGVVALLLAAWAGFTGGLFLLGWIGVNWMLDRRARAAHTAMIEPLAPMLAALEAGRREEALAIGERLLASGVLRDRAAVWAPITCARLALDADEPARAADALRKLPEGHAPPIALEVDVLVALGRAGEALEAAEDALRSGEVAPEEALPALCVAAHAAGAWSRGREAARAWAEATAEPVARYNEACFAAREGDVSGALDALEAAVAAGWGEPLGQDPDLASLAGHPRFLALARSETGGSK